MVLVSLELVIVPLQRRLRLLRIAILTQGRWGLRKSGNKIMENRRFSVGDGRPRGFALIRFGCQEVSIISSRDFQHSRIVCIEMDLRSFRVQIALVSLEIQAQHGLLLLAESYGCL